MILTDQEKDQLQYILPVQGSLNTLERVENILQIAAGTECNFSPDDIEFIKGCIAILDKNGKLSLSSLTLIRKFLSIKGE